MTEQTSKIWRSVMMAFLPALFFYIYYRLGLMDLQVFTWRVLIGYGLIIPAGWLLIWRVERRLLAVILMAAWFTFVVYTNWLSPWMPVQAGVGVLVIVSVLALLPSRQLGSTN